MIKKLSRFFYKTLYYFDKIFFLVTKRKLLIWFNEFLENDSYTELIILDRKINFFVPNQLVDFRVNSYFSKEPETIEWINSFNTDEEIIFWDIGANVGLYSIYNAIKHKNSKTISFEPSTSNLRVLSRNISINKFEKKIKIMPIPLTNVENKFFTMKEGQFVEGSALNSFGENFNFEGKNFQSEMNYTLLGTSINYLLDNHILEIPDYIKIDVDGIEHLILEGAMKYLSNQKIKSLSIEINENFTEQYTKLIQIMKKHNFKILHKKHNEQMFRNTKYDRSFNYIFIR